MTFCPVTNLQSFNWFDVSKHSCTLPIYIAASKSNQSIFCYFKFLILSATPLGKIIGIATPSFFKQFHIQILTHIFSLSMTLKRGHACARNKGHSKFLILLDSEQRYRLSVEIVLTGSVME